MQRELQRNSITNQTCRGCACREKQRRRISERVHFLVTTVRRSGKMLFFRKYFWIPSFCRRQACKHALVSILFSQDVENVEVSMLMPFSQLLMSNFSSCSGITSCQGLLLIKNSFLMTFRRTYGSPIWGVSRGSRYAQIRSSCWR
jgi:hypothetical protein